MSGPVDDFEFPDATAGGKNFRLVVGHWKYNAAFYYGSMNDIHRSRVTELWWYKSNEGLEAEYIVAICHREGEENDIILHLDCRPSIEDRELVVPENALPEGTRMGFSPTQYKFLKADVGVELRILKQTHWTTFVLQKSVPKKRKNYVHSVATVARLPGTKSLLGEHKRLLGHYHNFRPEKPFYVRDLAFLAAAIGQYQPKYHFFVNQCYWYARTLLNVVADVYRPSIIHGQDHLAGGTYNVDKRLNGHRISVSEDCQDEVKDIRKIFEECLRDHDSRTHARHTLREADIRLLEQSLINYNNTLSFSMSDVQATSSQRRIAGSEFSLDTFVSGTVDGKILEDFEATTCWIAAERASQQVRGKASQLAEVFSRWGFREPDYVVLAGFDESLIRAGVGYLEQIHVFVSAEVDASSPLLPELGKTFSPFSSILFTESSSRHIPVFKDDGSFWEFDELVHFTASKFADGGASAAMPPTMITLSPSPSPVETPSSSSQPNSGNGEQGGNKGKEKLAWH